MDSQSPRDGPAISSGQGTEITESMLIAGIAAYHRWFEAKLDDRRVASGKLVRAIYAAMEEARITGGL